MLRSLQLDDLTIDNRSGLMRVEDGRIVETAVEARAGFLDRPTLVVLATSTALIVALLAIVLIVFLI